jgi:LDH2 family malate/lactate/ureidoglycolate dehydrogenase
MPILTPARIIAISHGLLRAVGAPDGHAAVVAEHLADSNLAGHDSHGFIRIIQYLREIDEGIIAPKAEPTILNETTTAAQIDGNATFGQVVAMSALDIAVEKAREHGLSLVTMSNHQHTGRIGAYPEKAARLGMAAIMCTGFVGGTDLKNLAPFGGLTRKLGSNPISMSFPYTDDAPILLDFATSVVAEGKLRVARAKGEMTPDDWVITADGKPTRDPNEYYAGGSILPTGGLYGGHKGYALSFMVAMFSGIMAGLGNATFANTETSDAFQRGGTSLMLIDLGKLGSLDLIKEQVAGVVEYVKDTPIRDGFSDVFYPGEIEARTRRERTEKGVYIEDATWDEIVGLMDVHGVTDPGTAE